MRSIFKLGFRSFILSSVLFLFGCAVQNGQLVDPQDPYEHINRRVFAFNMEIDKYIAKPVARAYDRVLPNFIKEGIRNFFNNIEELPNVANDLLQGNPGQAVNDASRFVINSTVGILGLFDVADHFGIEKNYEDFDITLAKWGAKKTPYIVLPFFGPSSVRDAMSLPVYYFILDPLGYLRPWELSYGVKTVRLIDFCADLLVGDKVIDDAFDPYVFVRDVYLQRRAYLIDKKVQGKKDVYDKLDDDVF